jgi:hypothetical protein
LIVYAGVGLSEGGIEIPLNTRPDIVNAKMFPDGIAKLQTAVMRVLSLSGNHLLQIKFIAELKIG